MDTPNVALWGFAATVVLTSILSASRPLGFSRMDLPFFLGTMVTPNRDKASFYGILLHFLFGFCFAFIYALAIESSGLHTWWFGMVIGFVHGIFVLSAGLQIVSSFHPRMAHPYRGPTPTKLLQPPGFFALNYGRGTFAVTLVAHMVFGALLGVFY